VETAVTMISPIVEIPPKKPWTIRMAKSSRRSVVNPIRVTRMAWDSIPRSKRALGLNRSVRRPQKADPKVAIAGAAPTMRPVQRRVAGLSKGLTVCM
jgi:hypothetical protein